MLPAELPSSAALSFLGDAVHSRYIREMLVREGHSHAKDLNRLAQEYVTAEAQAAAWERIASHITEEEEGVFRRAANSTHLNRPRHTAGKTYRVASGFEAVLGMLAYVGDEGRIETLLALAYPKTNS